MLLHFEQFTGKDDCTDDGPDYMGNLTLKFEKQKIVDVLLDMVSDDDVITPNMTGRLNGSLNATQ